MSANMEDTMDVDEENMQIDEDPTSVELPMSTDEDSAQDTGVATKVVDVAMVSDSPDVDISEGPRAGSDGPTEMESDIPTDEVGNPSLVKVGDKDRKDSEKESEDRSEPVFETSTDTLRDDITSLCHTQTEETGDNSNISGTSEGVGELKNNPETATSTDADIRIAEKNNPAGDSNLSAENEVEPELEVENAVSNDETSQNNDGGNEDPLNSRAGLDTGENSNMTSVSASEENARDPFALDGDANSNAASEQPTNAPNEDHPVAESDLIISANIKPVQEGKSLAEELNEQLEKMREPRSADVTNENDEEKPADDDHISIDDASSTGVADVENADHVSVDGSSEGDRVPDHVSVDSDSDVENTTELNAESLKKTSDDRNVGSPSHTTRVDDELEETPGISGDSEKPADKSTDSNQLVIDVAADAATDKASNEEDDQTSKTNTVDLVESDDDSAQPTSSFSIRPRSSESLKGHITLIGKVVDTETIISDDTTSNRTGAVLRKELTLARAARTISTAEPSTPTSTKSDSSRLLKGMYSVKKGNSPVQWKCLQCATYQRCPWKIVIRTGLYYICSDKCLEAHRVQRKQIIESGGPPSTHIIQTADLNNLKKKCALCAAIIPKNKVGSLTWEVMNFCDDDCLSKYQSVYTSNCCNCNAIVATSSMGKYCVRFGHEVKQFCTPHCLDTYKKGIKTCSYCQKNLQDSSEGFLAPVGGKDQFRDFCSPDCLDKYDCICNNSTTAYSVDNCIVCDNIKVTQYELLSSTKVAKLCSDVCLAAYKFVNNIEVGICGMCNKYYDTMGVDETVTFNNDVPSTFCSKHCMNIHVISKRKIVPCAWCKAKKYNFDMVYRRGATDEDALFVCSVNCLVLHNVSLKALPPKKVNCSYCKKLDVSTYHITMSDASIRHFCSYECVLTFQSAFNVPALNANIPVPEGAAKKIVRSVEATVNSTSPGTQTAPSDGPTIQSVGTLKSIEPNNSTGVVPQNSTANKMKTLKIPATFCFKPPQMKNKWTQINVCGRTKGVTCKPKNVDMDVQCDLGVGPLNGEKTPTTDSAEEESSNESSSQTKAVIPIPVPIYVPHPMPMYTLPTPVPIPIPVPIIIPIIIPTSLENMDRVIDTLKEILEKSTGENPLASSSTAGLSNACNEMLQMRNEMDTGERNKRMLENDDSVEDLPPKRARVVEEDVSNPETSETPVKMKLKFMLGPNTWKHFAKNRNESSEDNDDLLKLDLLSMRSHELNSALAIFVREAKKPNGDEYRPDLKFYLCLGIQYYLFENGRVDDIFGDTTYEELTDALDLEARKFNSSIDSPISRVEEEHLWESMQLGAKSPHVLLMTLMYFITLRFNLWTLEEHMQLSFNTFSKEIKSDKPAGSKVIKLVINSSSDAADLKKQREFEFTENKKDLMRCPVRLYDFYITKCPENIKTHSDRFYLMPESSCTPESTVWYRSLALPPHMLEKMLNRVKMIKEIRESMHGHHGPSGDN